jgi:hypothetical protein
MRVAREHVRPDDGEFGRPIATPVRALLQRRQAGGEIRADIAESGLRESLIRLVAGTLVSADSFGIEETIASVTTVFLNGASQRQNLVGGQLNA